MSQTLCSKTVALQSLYNYTLIQWLYKLIQINCQPVVHVSKVHSLDSYRDNFLSHCLLVLTFSIIDVSYLAPQDGGWRAGWGHRQHLFSGLLAAHTKSLCLLSKQSKSYLYLIHSGGYSWFISGI